ncbi:MAG: hypothetical protein V4739_17555 [Pseudomonadota bacterium]
MRRPLSWCLVALCFTTLPAHALPELRAVTEDGRKVILSSDGRWQFDSQSSAARRPLELSSPYQTSVKNFSVAYNTSDWHLAPHKETEEINKRAFKHKKLPIYAMVIADEMPATTEAMKAVILSNAKSAGASTTVLLDQLQNVNGKEVGSLRFVANMQGLDFIFTTLYHADPNGNIQVMCYTAQALFHKYQANCQSFLDGLTIK